jgi:pantoate--beta-alanine ligase
MRETVSSVAGAKLDYAFVVDRRNLEPVREIDRSVILAIAGWFGKTRLIDNLMVPNA